MIKCKCIECNLPDAEIEKLDYKPPKPLKTGFLGLNAHIKPEQPNHRAPTTEELGKESYKSHHFEQPNTELLIVKTIQQLTHVISNELNKLDKLTLTTPMNYQRKVLITKALEDIPSFEQTTLELQKAFE